MVKLKSKFETLNVDVSEYPLYPGVIKFRINPDFRIEHSGMMHMMPYLLLLKFGFYIFK